VGGGDGVGGGRVGVVGWRGGCGRVGRVAGGGRGGRERGVVLGKCEKNERGTGRL